MAMFRQGPPNWGKNRDFRLIFGLAIHDYYSVERQLTLSHSAADFVYHGDGRRSASISESWSLDIVFCRAMLRKRGRLCRHAVSVCLSVRLSVCHVRGFCQNE